MAGAPGTAAVARAQGLTAETRPTGHVQDEGPQCGVHILLDGLA